MAAQEWEHICQLIENNLEVFGLLEHIYLDQNGVFCIDIGDAPLRACRSAIFAFIICVLGVFLELLAILVAASRPQWNFNLRCRSQVAS
jgi:hypothetical protein